MKLFCDSILVCCVASGVISLLLSKSDCWLSEGNAVAAAGGELRISSSTSGECLGSLLSPSPVRSRCAGAFDLSVVSSAEPSVGLGLDEIRTLCLAVRRARGLDGIEVLPLAERSFGLGLVGAGCVTNERSERDGLISTAAGSLFFPLAVFPVLDIGSGAVDGGGFKFATS
jgi:hypothetical protein